jgi:site-specific DNA-methyltransferase (adenine-specific)
MENELNLINGDCLEEMKKIEDNTIDLLFCDLPFGCTSCKWDCQIDLSLFWKEINRICKTTCPMFFCCNAKFGNTLINSNPKNFRYDLVWIKSTPVGFLNAKKMPMKKHELIYVFYRKLPLYDISSHSHKFLGERESNRKGKKDGVDNKGVWKNRSKSGKETSNSYNPPLPTSIIKTELYSNTNIQGKRELYRNESNQYEPPLPTTIIKDIDEKYQNKGGLYSEISRNGLVKSETHYEPPLPNTILEIKSEKGKHPTQKPIKLIEWILKYYSREGDTILDPTMGSGSSGVACNNMNRKYIGIELDETIFKNAEKRLKKI